MKPIHRHVSRDASDKCRDRECRARLATALRVGAQVTAELDRVHTARLWARLHESAARATEALSQIKQWQEDARG